MIRRVGKVPTHFWKQTQGFSSCQKVVFPKHPPSAEYALEIPNYVPFL